LADGYSPQFAQKIYELGAEETFRKKSSGILSAIYSPDFAHMVYETVYGQMKLKVLRFLFIK
jgi:hypothetical protein